MEQRESLHGDETYFLPDISPILHASNLSQGAAEERQQILNCRTMHQGDVSEPLETTPGAGLDIATLIKLEPTDSSIALEINEVNKDRRNQTRDDFSKELVNPIVILTDVKVKMEANIKEENIGEISSSFETNNASSADYIKPGNHLDGDNYKRKYDLAPEIKSELSENSPDETANYLVKENGKRGLKKHPNDHDIPVSGHHMTYDKRTESVDLPLLAEDDTDAFGEMNGLNSDSSTMACISSEIEERTLLSDMPDESSTRGKRFSCAYCDKRFINRSNLAKHLRSHSGDKPYGCPHCDLKCSSKAHLKEHIRKHTGEKPFPCPYCDKRFTRNSVLTIHLRQHTGEMPYACPHCDKRFNDKSHLPEHIRNHTGERPFPCPYCDKRYNTKSHLSAHIQKHTHKNMFICNYCDQKFTTKARLNIHLKKHNSDKETNLIGKELLCRIVDLPDVKVKTEANIRGQYVGKISVSFKMNREAGSGDAETDSHLKYDRDTHEERKYELPRDITSKRVLMEESENGETLFLRPDEKVDVVAEEHGPRDLKKRPKGHNVRIPEHHNVPELNKDYSDSVYMNGLNSYSLTNASIASEKKERVLLSDIAEDPSTRGNRFSCAHCTKRFFNRSNLAKHLSKHLGDKDKPFGCSHCDLKCTTKGHLNEHMRIHTGEKRYHCPYCEKRFTRNSVLTIHLRKHTGEMPFTCSHCDKRFSDKSHLRQHIRTHTEERPFPCLYCDERYDTQSHLSAHIQKHGGEKSFICTHCDRTFNAKWHLKMHLCEHRGYKVHTCDYCDKPFPTKNRLKKHLRNHKDDKLFCCSDCNKTFKNKFCLELHIRTHTDVKPYPCPHCDQGFDQKSFLTQHISTHTGVKPFSCSHCEKKYFSKRGLQYHILLHTSKVTFPCPNCDKKYFTKKGLTDHMWNHTGLKPFPCTFCDKGYANKSDLRQHLLKHTP